MKYYNNHLNKRGISGVYLNDYVYTLNQLSFRSTNKIDLTSIFLFIYGELKFGPLRFFLNKHSKFEVEVVFYTTYEIERYYNFEYDFDLEDNIYNYKNDKLYEISNLFRIEGSDILDNFLFAEYYIKIK